VPSWEKGVQGWAKGTARHGPKNEDVEHTGEVKRVTREGIM